MTEKIHIRLFALDDDEAIRIRIKDALSHADIDNVEIFEHHVAFFEQFNEHVHIAIIDHSLDDGITGLMVMERILEINPACHVIAISGNPDPKLIIEYYNKGCFRFQLKNDQTFTGELMVNVNAAYHKIYKILSFYQNQILALDKIVTKSHGERQLG